MKLLLNGCAFAALALGLSGHASAQIEVIPAPIHAVPADPDGAQGALVGKAAPDEAGQARAERVVAAITEPPPGRPALNPQETAFFSALGHRLTDAASAYEDYVKAVGAIDSRFTTPGQIQAALGKAEAYNVAQLQEGAVAYAAVVALRTQSFVDGVRAQADPALVDRLVAEPDQVMAIRGAGDAAEDVANVMHAQAQAVAEAGQSICTAAYTIQRQPWSRGAVAEPEKVLASAKASALKAPAADVMAERRLLDSIGDAPQAGQAGAASPEVVRGLALAAIAVLGQAGDAHENRFEPLLRDLRNADCLQMAKMNLNQCLAVAGPQYEDVFCLGQHAVGETGRCLTSAAGGGPAPGPALRTAELEGYGSEREEAYAAAPSRPVQPGD